MGCLEVDITLDRCKKGIFNNSGLTLIEIIAVVVVLSIVSAIAIPSILGIIDNTEEDVCHANRLEIERKFERHMDIYNVEFSEGLFEQHLSEYGEEVCPVGGEIMRKIMMAEMAVFLFYRNRVVCGRDKFTCFNFSSHF